LLVNAGHALRALGRHGDSVALYERAHSVDNSGSGALANVTAALSLANVLGDLAGRERDAVALYERIVAEQPTHALALLKFGELLGRLERWDRAVPTLEKAVKASASARCYAALAAALVARGGSDATAAAIGVYEKACAADAKNADVRVALGQLQYEAGFLEDAVKTLEVAVQLEPSNAVTHNALGIAYQALQLHQDAVGHFTKAVELDGRLCAALANLGHVLDDMGLYQEAVAHFKRAVELDPQASWYKKLGIALVHMEKYAEAIEEFLTGVAIDAKDPTIHYNMAAAYGKQGKLNEAMMHATIATELDATFEAGQQMTKMLRPHSKPDAIEALRAKYAADIQIRVAKAQVALKRTAEERKKRDAADADRKRARAAEQESKIDADRKERDADAAAKAAKEKAKAAAKEKAKAAEKAAKAAEVDRKRKELEEQREAERARREAEAKARAEAEAKAAAKREEARKAAEAAAAAEKAAAERARKEAEAAAAEAKRLQAEAEVKARAAAEAAQEADAQRIRADAAAAAEKARREAEARAAAAEAAEKARREREEERLRAEALARRKAEQEAAEAKALAEMEALMAAEMDAAAEEELARAVQEAADDTGAHVAPAAAAAAANTTTGALASSGTATPPTADDDVDDDDDDKKDKKHRRKHTSSSSSSNKKKKDKDRTLKPSKESSPTKEHKDDKTTPTVAPAATPAKPGAENALTAVPRDAAALWQHKEPVDELLKEYKTTRQGLNQQQRRERFNKFGENRCVVAYPAKLVDKTVCLVLQEGEWVRVHPRTLVPGDVLLLQSNTWVPADVRVLTSLELALRRPGEARTLSATPDVAAGSATAAACIALQGDVVQSGWGTAMVLRGGATPSGALQEAAERIGKHDDNARHAETVDYDAATQALSDELHNVNGIDLLSKGALANLEKCSMVVAQHSAFLMDKIDFKSVFWDGEFLQAPLIKWIAARERLAALQGDGGAVAVSADTDSANSNNNNGGAGGGNDGGDDDDAAAADMDAAEAFASGRYAAALRKLKAESESAKVLFNIGVVQLRAEQYRDALASFDASLAKDKYLAIGYHERAACRLRLDDESQWPAALKDAEKALELLRTNAFVDYGQMSLNYRLARASVLANVALCRVLAEDADGAKAAASEARRALGDVSDAERAAVTKCLDEVDTAILGGDDMSDDAAALAIAMDSAVLFDTMARTDPNAGPRPSAGSSRLHSRGVFEALRRLAALCSTGERRKPKPRKVDEGGAVAAAAASDDPVEKAKRLEAELKEAKMKMMMLVGNMGKSQAKLKTEPNNAALQAEVGKSMKELAATKARVAELEQLTSGGEKRVGGSVLISLTKARKEFEADPLRGVSMYKRATEWELQNQLTFRNEWETEVMATLDTTAPKLAQFYDWFEPGARVDTPGDVVQHMSLWLEVDSGQWYLCWRGNLEVVLQLASHQLTGEKATPAELSDAKRRAVRRQFLHEPNVIAYAQKAVELDFDPATESPLRVRRFMEDQRQGSVFVGCIVLRDTLQPNVKQLVRRLIGIGVKVVLLTDRSRLAAEVSAHNLDLLDYTPESALDELDRSGKPFGLEDAGAGDALQRSAPSAALARITGSKIFRKASNTISNTIKGEVDPNNLPVRAATLQVSKALVDHSWIKAADQIVVHSAASDCAPLLQLANREKQSVCFIGDRDCVNMLEAADVGCVYARAASALTRRSDVHCGNNLFEDVVFALEATKAMKIRPDKAGGRLVAAKPEAKPEQRPEESTGKVANFFLDLTFQ
jgi:tetratricopeptide (TPR) repeat protein